MKQKQPNPQFIQFPLSPQHAFWGYSVSVAYVIQLQVGGEWGLTEGMLDWLWVQSANKSEREE